MSGRLDLRKWIQIHYPAYAVVQSGDGQYMAVGTEMGALLFNLGGHRLATYPSRGEELPVHQLCAPLDFARLILATRLGNTLHLKADSKDGSFEIEEIASYSAEYDVHTLAFSAATERVAIGHLSFALTVLDLEGEVIWRQQDHGAAALGTTWSVDLDPNGERLYAGNAGGDTNWLVVLDAATGALQHKRECDAPVTAVAALPDDLGVAILTPRAYHTARLTVCGPNLTEVKWEKELHSPATALAADPVEPLLVVGVGYEGDLILFNPATGECLASKPVRATVNGLSLVGGKFVAAATQDGNVALMRYVS